MSVCQPRLSGVRAFIPSSQPFLWRWFLLSLSCLLCWYPALAQQPTGAVDTPVTVTGVLHVVHGDDFDHHRSKFLYHLEELQTKKHFHLHFLHPPTAHLHSGAIVTVQGTAHGSEIVVAAAGGTSLTTIVPATAPTVSGEQKTLVLVANFSNAAVGCSAANIRDTLFTDPSTYSIDDLYQETSYGQLWFTGDVYGPYSINYATTSPCDYYAWANAAEAAATASGVNLSQYTRRVYVLPSQNSCGYIGLGTIGGSPSRAWIFRCDLHDVFGHELGHNLVTQHASTLSSEYGDTSDIMGYSGIGLRHMNAPHKEELGWLPAGQVVTVTQNGTYKIAPLELHPVETAAPQALKIAKRDTNEYYYFSYRLPLGFDANLASTYTNRVNVHRYAGSGAVYTYFLQGLVDGSSFTDAVNGVTVTQVSHDVNTATVQVALTCAPAIPTLSVSPSSQSSKAGATVSYTVSVTNKDSAACPQATLNLAVTVPSGWTGTMTPNTLTLLPGEIGSAVLAVTSSTGTSTGSYSVQVEVFDNLVAVHAASASVTDVVDSTPPTAPTNLKATVRGNKVQLSWGAASDNVGVSSYGVWRNSAQIGSSTGTSYTDGSAASGMTYTYYVVARDKAGNVSAASNAVTVKR